MRNAWLIDATRTPFGRLGGALAAVRADDLAAQPIAALLARHPRLDPAAIDEVILGCANQAGEDNRNVARMAALLAGLPAEVPGVTVNRLCASGLEAIGQAARAIACGEAGLVIAGGVESMTRAPYVLAKADSAFARNQQLEDTTLGWRLINPRMRAGYGVDSMTQTAENLAREHGIDRASQDAYALRSQGRAAYAQRQGWLAEEITPVALRADGAAGQVALDEHPRPATTDAQLAALNAGELGVVQQGGRYLLVTREIAEQVRDIDPHPLALLVDPNASGVGEDGVPDDLMW